MVLFFSIFGVVLKFNFPIFSPGVPPVFHLRHQQRRGQVHHHGHAGGAHHRAQDPSQQVGAPQAPEIRDPILGQKWRMVEIHGFSWILVDFHGISWILVDFHGISWILVDFHGISWVLVDWMWSLKALHHIKLHDMTFYIALLYILLNYIAFTWHDMTLHRGTGG